MIVIIKMKKRPINAERKFDSRIIAKRYVSLYHDVLEGRPVDVSISE